MGNTSKFLQIGILVLICLFATAVIPSTSEAADDIDIAFSGNIWFPGTIDVEGVDVDKNLGFLIRGFIDSYVAAQIAFGAYINLAQPEVERGGTSESVDMYEFGVSIKYKVASMPLKIGLNIGYRIMESDYFNDDVDGMGLNLSVEYQLGSPGSFRPFIEAGFLSQPTGGNDAVSVSWAPIIYAGAGIVF